MDEIINVILNYVEPDEEITGDSLLKQDCGLTSFDTTCIVGELCDKYGVSDKDLKIRSIRTVRDLYDALEKAAEEKKAG